MYNNAGQQGGDYGYQGQQPGQQFRPPVAPPPHQQAGSDFGATAARQTYYDGQGLGAQSTPGENATFQQQYAADGSYFPAPSVNQGIPPQDNGLASQMGGMSLGEGYVAPRGGKKKKDRHAYHTLEAPVGTSDAFNNTPSLGASQFQQPQGGQFGGQFTGQEITPQMSQFPAPAGQQFIPETKNSQPGFGGPNGPQPPPTQETSVQTSAQGRVDADQIPSIPRSRDVMQPHYLANVYPTFEHHLPPPAAVSFVAFDQGNSSPKFARLTMNNIPSGSEGLKSTGLPLGLVLQPLAPLQAGEQEIPVLDFGETGPPRCHRCRAYINPFMVFRNGGNKFVCNMCTYPNDVPPEYFCATTPQGARVDREQRPELMKGTVEFLVPKEYWSKEPVGLRTLFVIDVCQESFNKGYLTAVCQGILSALYGAEEEAQSGEDGSEIKRSIPLGAKVGFITYDKDIHFYNCNVSSGVLVLVQSTILMFTSLLLNKLK